MKKHASVWDALEATPAKAASMKLRANLMDALRAYIEKNQLSQKEAAKLFGVTQPRISDLIRGRIDLFALDTLVNMVSASGMGVKMRVTRRKGAKAAARTEEYA
jgi:predicted XRE-type DNA-binding protein